MIRAIILVHCWALGSALRRVPAATFLMERRLPLVARAEVFVRQNTDARRKSKASALKRHNGRKAATKVNELGYRLEPQPNKAQKRRIDVVLLEAVDGLGEAGEVVSVSPTMFEHALLKTGKARLQTKKELLGLAKPADDDGFVVSPQHETPPATAPPPPEASATLTVVDEDDFEDESTLGKQDVIGSDSDGGPGPILASPPAWASPLDKLI